MKFKLNIFGIFIIAAIQLATISTKSVKAYIIVAHSKVILCQTNNPDGTIFYGTHCESGTKTCRPNPCD